MYQLYIPQVEVPAGQPVNTYPRIVQKTKYITIYEHGDTKFVISEDLLRLIRYFPLNGRTKQYNYKRVMNPVHIYEIEKKGFKWSAQEVDYSNEYFVLRQINMESNRYTKVVKIVRMTDATVKQWRTVRIEADSSNWIYYEME